MLSTVCDLASLVAPAAESDFIAAFVRKERMIVKAPDARRAEGLLPQITIERLIASDLLPSMRLSVLRDGEVVAPHRFRTDDGRLHVSAMEGLVREGVSLIVTGIHDDVPAIERLRKGLELRLGHDVWVNAYVTHGPGGALPPHYDDHDVLALQVHGSKRWHGHGVPFPSPIERSPDGVDFGPSHWELLLEPGDLLYLPRGEAHHAMADGPLSVHLTFGIDTRRGIDFLSSVVEHAKSEGLFRQDLTRLGGTSSLELRERALKDRMHALIEEADLGAYLTTDEAARHERRSRR